MLLDVTTAKKNPGKKFDFKFSFKADDSLINNSLAVFHGNVTAQGGYFYNGGNVYVKGTVDFCIDYPCDRCLKRVFHKCSVTFDEVFFSEPGSEEDYIYEGGYADLTKPLNDCLLLNMPMGVVCARDCKGLCPECGADLNLGKCGCGNGTSVEPNPFAILKNINNH